MLLPRNLLVCALVVSFLSSSLSQEYVCPTDSTANLTDDNMITFVPLPAGSQLRTTAAEYNPGGLVLWYNLASGVIEAARPGGLPYETINTVLQPFYARLPGGQGNVTINDPFRDVVNTVVQPLSTYFAGIIALTVIGGLIALCLPVCGCCFCCCRLCGFCGGKLKQKDTKYNDCLTWTFTILLILFTCGLSVGVIFSFLSNQQVFDSLRNFQSTADNALSDVDTFINNTLDEVNFLFCQFNDTVDVGIMDAQRGVDEVLGTVNSLTGGVNNVVDSVVSLSQNINSTLEELQSIQNDVNTLRDVTLAQLRGNLTQIADQLDSLQMTCNNINISMFTCPDLNADMFRNAINIDLNQVPNVDEVIQNIDSVLQGQNIADLARQANETFNNLVRDLPTQVSAAINQFRSNSSQLSTGIDQIRSQITPILSEVNSVNVLDNARRTINNGYQLITPYDTARYALGIVICSLAAVVVVVIFIGVLCGVIGFRRNREPDDRTALSNCGGITLLFAVALAFIFGFLLLLLSALTFFAGGILQKSCQSIAPPQVELLAETIDNPANTGGQYLLGSVLLRNGSLPLTISGILANCSTNGTTVFQALMLNQLLDLQQLRNSVAEQIPSDLSSITSDFTFDTDTILPDDLRMRLTNFSDSGVANINFTSYQDQLSRTLLSVDLQAQIDLLTNLSNTAISLMTPFTTASQNESLMNVSDTSLSIISTIGTINSSLANIMDQVDMLGVSANQLSNSADSFTDATNDVINEADQLVNGPMGIKEINTTLVMTYSRVLGHVSSYVDHVIDTIQNQLGNCGPVAVIYTGAYNSLCRFTLDGLNGFWLALGWCGIFFLPVIIFAILAQQYYRRMKVDEEFPHDDSFPLKTY